jgi:CRISPR-associated exonuclease Cas4
MRRYQIPMTTFYNLQPLTPTHINYAVVCDRKLWFFSMAVRLEKESDLVSMGKLIHEGSYEREKKEIEIDGVMKIDFMKIKEGVIHEVKKSRKIKKAHTIQLLYVLYYLKNLGIEHLTGLIDYPLLKKREKVILHNENEQVIRDTVKRAYEIISLEKPPKIEKKRICRKCSYFELCFC